MRTCRLETNTFSPSSSPLSPVPLLSLSSISPSLSYSRSTAFSCAISFSPTLSITHCFYCSLTFLLTSCPSFFCSLSFYPSFYISHCYDCSLNLPYSSHCRINSTAPLPSPFLPFILLLHYPPLSPTRCRTNATAPSQYHLHPRKCRFRKIN